MLLELVDAVAVLDDAPVVPGEVEPEAPVLGPVVVVAAAGAVVVDMAPPFAGAAEDAVEVLDSRGAVPVPSVAVVPSVATRSSSASLQPASPKAIKRSQKVRTSGGCGFPA
ncbi:MAG: hypothetical protein QOD77_1610 [Thermoplasmata archaeon]|nr:hypothetical protein [Thermoplasmata archaeon]